MKYYTLLKMNFLVLLLTVSLISKSAPPVDTVIPSGTLIQVQTSNIISTKGGQYSQGQKVSLIVAYDVLLNGKVAIKGGSPVDGVITEFKKERGVGKGGKITIQVNSIRAADGTIIPITPAYITREGDSRMGLALGLGLGLGLCVFPPLLACMAIKGYPAIIESGYSVNCTVLTATRIRVE